MVVFGYLMTTTPLHPKNAPALESSDLQHAEELQFKRFRSMTPTEKLAASLALYYSARALKAAWVRSTQPHLPEREVLRLVRESFMYAGT